MVPHVVNQNVSELVCCCSANSWSQVIGWLHAIFSGIGLALLAFVMTPQVMRTYESAWKTGDDTLLVILITALCFLIVKFVGAIFLLQGVYQESVGNILSVRQSVCKIQIWTAIQIVSLVFSVLVITIRGGSPQQVVQEFIPIIINIFFLWVVSIHKQEILLQKAGAGGASVSYVV